MPSYQFTGLVETMYPFDRDAAGRPVGAVQPGGVRDLDEPLDWQWVSAGDGQAAVQSLEEPDSGVLFADAREPVPEPAADAPGPQPAPPAVVPPGPQPFAVTTGT